MSKLISLTPSELAELKAEFEKALAGLKLSDGKVSFTKTFSNLDQKAEVFVTASAWAKMQGLVNATDKEVAWHGVAYRCEDESKNEYCITDVLVYPQTVTGATVDMDVAEYTKWLCDNDEDERMFNIHMQGHSHVNMGVTPSSVDLNHNEEILRMLPKDGFYIFMILNKKWDKTVKIYDLKKNLFFDTADCKVTVLDPPTPDGIVVVGASEEESDAALKCIANMRIAEEVKSFVTESDKMVKTRVYKPYTGNAYGYNKQPETKANVVTPPAPAKASESGKASVKSSGNGKRKGKRRKNETQKSKPAASGYNYKGIYSYDDDDDDYGYGGDFYNYWR